MLDIDKIHLGDCLELMTQIDDKSINMILCDPPYGITSRNEWDQIIPIRELWEQYRRIIADNGVIVITSYGLFSAQMMLAAPDLYKYSLVWQKNKPRGFLNANKQPLRSHEDILVFYKKQPPYNPQKTTGHDPVHSFTKHIDSLNYGRSQKGFSGGGSTERFPTSIIPIPVINNEDPDKIHPTQKPVELGEYLIKTFTNEGDLVLDNACGSGAFLVAAKTLKRHFLGIEKNVEFHKSACKFISRTW